MALRESNADSSVAPHGAPLTLQAPKIPCLTGDDEYLRNGPASEAERYRTLFNCNPECIKVLGKDGSLLDINPAGLRFLEAESMLEVHAHGLPNFVLPAYRSAFSGLLQRVMAGGTGMLAFEICGLRGGHRWLETHATPLIDAAGEVTMILTVTRDITAARLEGAARRAAESALRISDVALKSVTQGVLIAAPDRRILSVNAAFTRITGYAESEVVGRTCRFMQGLLTDPQTVLRIRERVQMFMEYSGEIINYRKDGRPFWNELTISPVFDDNGVATHFIGITRDATARKQADQVWREGETQIGLGTHGGNLGIWDWDVGAGSLRVNERWLTMLGLEPHAHGLAPSIELWHSLVHADDMPKLAQILTDLRSSPECQIDVELRALHREGHWIWIHVVGSVIERNPEGGLCRVVGTHADITARKLVRAERALAAAELSESEALARMRLHRILDEVAAYSITFDASRCILHASEALLQRAGYAAGELIGKPLSLLLGDDQVLRVLPPTRSWEVGDRAVHSLVARDGSSWPVYMVVTPTNSGDERIFLLVGRDREAEVAAEARLDWLRQTVREAREHLHAEFLQRQQLEMAFLDISEREQARIGQDLHDDVGQQLAGIAFLGRALQKKLQIAGREEAGDAEWIAQLLAQTLDSLRSIARDLSPGGLESGNLEKSLRSMCARLERLHGVACEVVVDASESDIVRLTPMLSLNLFRIAQEALNNSLRHGDPKLVTFRLRLRSIAGTLTIRDNGTGFDVVKASDGMGLRNIRVRVHGLGGRLRICSGAAGTLVAVRFPVPVDNTHAPSR